MGGSMPAFSEQDNPASFSPYLLTRYCTETAWVYSLHRTVSLCYPCLQLELHSPIYTFPCLSMQTASKQALLHALLGTLGSLGDGRENCSFYLSVTPMIFGQSPWTCTSSIAGTSPRRQRWCVWVLWLMQVTCAKMNPFCLWHILSSPQICPFHPLPASFYSPHQFINIGEPSCCHAWDAPQHIWQRFGNVATCASVFAKIAFTAELKI